MERANAPLTLGTCLTMLVTDWTIYSATLLSYADALWTATVSGAVVAFILVALFEGGSDHPLSKALAAALAVAIPLPMVGSVVSLVGLVWLMVERQRRHDA